MTRHLDPIAQATLLRRDGNHTACVRHLMLAVDTQLRAEGWDLEIAWWRRGLDEIGIATPSQLQVAPRFEVGTA